MAERESPLRARAREVIREDIARVAVGLFLDRGYEATTIDDIAKAAGMSPRSVFRYSPTKRDIVVGKFGRGVDDMLAGLRSRPAGEADWVSLRRMFDVVDTTDDPDSPRVQRMIFETTELLSEYLRTLHDAQRRAGAHLVDRAAATDAPYAPDDPTPRALAAAAFGCLLTAQESFLASDDGAGALAPHLDRAMDAVIRVD